MIKQTIVDEDNKVLPHDVVEGLGLGQCNGLNGEMNYIGFLHDDWLVNA